jgi:hypothetical protein
MRGPGVPCSPDRHARGSHGQHAVECRGADRWAESVSRTVLLGASAGVGSSHNRGRRRRCGDPRTSPIPQAVSERRHPGWQVTAFAPWREGDGMSASLPIRTDHWRESRVSLRWLSLISEALTCEWCMRRATRRTQVLRSPPPAELLSSRCQSIVRGILMSPNLGMVRCWAGESEPRNETHSTAPPVLSASGAALPREGIEQASPLV